MLRRTKPHPNIVDNSLRQKIYFISSTSTKKKKKLKKKKYLEF
jgi:hypothetical protein